MTRARRISLTPIQKARRVKSFVVDRMAAWFFDGERKPGFKMAELIFTYDFEKYKHI